MKVRKEAALALLLAACACAGCEKAPAAPAADGGKAVERGSEKMVSVREAARQAGELEGKSAYGIRFPERIPVTSEDTVSLLKLKEWHTDDVSSMYGVIRSIWTDYEKYDWSRAKKNVNTPESIPGYYGESNEDRKTGVFFSCDNRGFFSGDSLNDTEIMVRDAEDVKEYDFMIGKKPEEGESYKLEDGEEPVQDAISYAEEKFNKNLSKLEKGRFTYKVQLFYALKDPEDGFYDYQMVVGRVYRGIPVETCSDFSNREGESYDKRHCGAHMFAYMRHKGNLDFVNTTDELYDVESESESEKIISPIWAAKKINDEIAHERGMGFFKCGLVYVLEQKNEEPWSFGWVDDTTYLRPVWLFAQRLPGAGGNYARNSYGPCVIVDAIDGTMYYYGGGTAGY